MTPPRKRSTRSRSGAAATEAAAPEPSAAAADLASVRRPAQRKRARSTVMDTILEFPNYLRLLFGLLTDRRVAVVDKALVAGAIAYIISPIDMIPDFIPFLGQVDDAFLLLTALERLITNAGRKVVMTHWAGDPTLLSRSSLRMALLATTFFLPKRIRRRLRGL